MLATSSVRTVGANTATSAGTALSWSGTPNTKGSYTEIDSSTTFASWGVAYLISNPPGSTDTESFLIDLATGAAGSETVRVANCHMGLAANFGNFQPHILPIEIASGTRIAMRGQRDSNSTVAVLTAELLLFQKSTNSGSATSQTYGADTSDSGGAAVDPGGSANTKGSYTELTASTTAAMDWLVAEVGNQGATMSSATWLIDIATGAGGAETVVVADLAQAVSSQTDTLRAHAVSFPIAEIAASTRIAARAQSTLTTASTRDLDVVIHGFNLATTRTSTVAQRTVGQITSSATRGTILTGSGTANTKSSYVELDSSTTFESWALLFQAGYHTSNANTSRFMIDLATGAAGAESVVVANMHLNPQNTRGQLGPHLLPLTIATSTRIAARAQRDATSTAQIIGVTVTLLDADTAVGASAVQTYGANTADTTGATVDPGATINTKGSYTEVTSSTSADANWLSVSISTDVTTGVDATWLVDLATGAGGAETVRVADVQIAREDLNDTVFAHTLSIPTATIASGTRIAARAQCNDNTSGERALDVVIHAANLAAAPDPVTGQPMMRRWGGSIWPTGGLRVGRGW